MVWSTPKVLRPFEIEGGLYAREAESKYALMRTTRREIGTHARDRCCGAQQTWIIGRCATAGNGEVMLTKDFEQPNAAGTDSHVSTPSVSDEAAATPRHGVSIGGEMPTSPGLDPRFLHTFSCASNTGNNVLIGSFIAPGGLTAVNGMIAQIDEPGSRVVPSRWWDEPAARRW